MTLSSLFGTRFGRIAILTFTVISVVATSAPGTWSKDASTPPETVTIAPGATLVRKVAITASESGATPSVEFYLDSTTDPNLDVTVTSCPGANAYLAADAGPLEVQRNAENDADGGTQWNLPKRFELALPSPLPVAICNGASPSTFEIDIKNIGAAETTLTWHSTGTIGGVPDDGEDAPSGARVAVTVTP